MKMRLKDPEKLKKARNIINLLLEGINPVDYEPIEDESFLNDPKMIRIFSYLALVLNQDIQEAEEEEDREADTVSMFANRVAGENAINSSYKSINDKIKSSKITAFNKANSAELKKLAELMEKSENSV